MASVTTPTASAATMAASADLDDNDLGSSSEASSSDDVQEEEEDDYDEEEEEDDYDDVEEEDEDGISLLTTKMQHSSDPLEDLLSLGRVDQEYVTEEIIRKANLYDDMVRLAQEDASSMKHFFTPSLRLQDRFDMFNDEVHVYTEVELAVSIEEFLNHRSNWSDFRAFSTGDEGEMGKGKLIWITEDMFFWIEENNNEVEFIELEEYVIQRATFTATNGETHDLVLAEYRNSSLSAGAFSVFWHVVTTSKCVKLKLKSAHRRSALLFETTPSQFLETSSRVLSLRKPAAVLLQLCREGASKSLLRTALLTPWVRGTLSSSGFGTVFS